MTRTALIQSGTVINVIIDSEHYQPPDGMTTVASETAQIGDSYDGSKFSSVTINFTKSDLVNYAKGKLKEILINGVTVNANTGDDAPLMIHCNTDTDSRVNLISCYLLAREDSTFSIPWVSGTNTIKLTAKQIMIVAPLVFEWVESIYVTLSLVTMKITASSIKTPAQIDKVAWPVNS